ncbi:ABC transporter ATP-binding protein [Chelatococcus reniformis]|uniref:ABC transporter ATP-binding protein n=1 Tax=Chelatococcus reniformis TaxID=1494448 RepID=UPI00166C8EA0|nr:ABC transporter ATP-binding protein [Chelatococcus reniformis]
MTRADAPLTTTPSSALLEVRAVSKSFGGLHVLRAVDLTIARGSITGLIGPNGAGKSTLFNIVSGFLAPDRGDVIYHGRPIGRISVVDRSRAGLVRTFQTPQVFGHLTVRENLVAGCHKLGRSGMLADMLGLPLARRELAQMQRRAALTAARFSLEPVADVLAGKLPVGQQRLLELARAAIADPELLCLDEPSSGLNGDEVDQLARMLTQLNEEGMTVFLVSHDMELMGCAATVNVLCFGETIASGPFAAVKADPRVREAYLGA